MLADRSPGERIEGALASLKQRLQPAPHERALAKVRRPALPVSPLAGLVTAPPPAEFIPPAAGPLYSMVAGPPVAVVPSEAVSPPILGGGGGGGGGVIIP